MGATAQSLIERYKYVDGQHFGERKHWLQDDYVKFIAFAHKKMDAVPEGVVGVITNHSWLDNPTFRGDAPVADSLAFTIEQMATIDEVYRVELFLLGISAPLAGISLSHGSRSGLPNCA